jgi:trehalose 6-phosphate phosphatase
MTRLESLWDALAEVAARIARARALFVATDFDGTLAPIARRPRAASPARGALASLRRISRLPRAGVAVLSGRGLDDLARVAGVRGAFLSGASGLATRDARGRRAIHVPRARRLPVALAATLAAWCARFRGAWLEDKELVLALHYRAVAPHRHAAFRAGVRRRLAPLSGRARIVPGKRVLEVMPATRESKATALARAIPHGRGTLLVFFGDDENDEPAHAFVRRRGGIAIAVGGRRSRAEYALRSPREVALCLAWLADAWSDRVKVPG